VTDDDNGQETGFHLSLMQRLRAYLFAGILITAPVSITIYLSWLVVHFVDERVNNLLPRDYNPNHYLPFSVPGLGLLIVLLALIFIGGLAAGLIGRAFVRISEGVLHRTPVVRSIYSAIKQIFHTILAERAQAFRQVVLVEFPRTGLWRIGFVTGVTPGKTQEVVPGGLVNVFIPGTPNVTAGFLVLVPKDEAIELELTAEEAIKLIVSGGIATPPPRADAAPEEPPR
jgi:uncharacterized membrane protein